MKYLITGSGGREHVLAWKLSQSDEVTEIYCMPGNAGTATTKKTTNIENMTIEQLVLWAQENNINRLLAGSEDLLVQGIVDTFNSVGIESFGPHQDAAQLEGSKSFAKEFMNKYNIRTATHKVFREYVQAIEYIETHEYPLVIKADGLAAGKGVLICNSKKEARSALNQIMKEKKFGEAGSTVVIEQFLSGYEVSILALYDGERITPLLSAKDHKKIKEGERGANTGGMGVIVPNPLFSDIHNSNFVSNILNPTQEGLDKENLNFCGVIFFGIMVQDNECYLLEYNLRFGDPEIQTILTLMDSDFHAHISACMNKELYSEQIKWSNQSSCCVVLSSAGYPEKYEVGREITFDERVNAFVFVAGAVLNTNSNTHTEKSWITSGGRVIDIVAHGDNLEEAIIRAYKSASCIHFEGKYMRKDIGRI